MSVLTGKFNSISLPRGGMFSVELSEDYVPGYSWEFTSVSGNGRVARLEHNGGSALFRAEAVGDVVIKAQYKHKFDGDARQEKFFNINVRSSAPRD